MPILVQTALDTIDQKLRAFKLGATDYICKPIDAGELLARTRVHLMQKLLMQDLRDYHTQTQAELSAARQMQDRLMPSGSQIKICERVFDMDIGVHVETSSQLGGDFWGIRPLSEQRMAVYMLDFSGHGVSAAMNVFRIHTVMQECQHATGDPAHFLTLLNRHLYPLLERHEFATMFYGIIDTQANCLIYAAAAMHPVLLFSKQETAPIELDHRGFALGAMANTTYESRAVPFMRGDLLLLYSDCLIESANANGIFLDEHAIASCVNASLNGSDRKSAKDVVASLAGRLQAESPQPLRDDLTITAYLRG